VADQLWFMTRMREEEEDCCTGHQSVKAAADAGAK